jgi:hypothetical protein
MKPFYWHLVEFGARALEATEREVVLGDLAEEGGSLRALGDVVGLVVRREAALWGSWQPWAVLVGMKVPFALLLSLTSRRTADFSVLALSNYRHSWRWNLFGIDWFQRDVLAFLGSIPLRLLHVLCSSWGLGFLIGLTSRKPRVSTATVFCVALILANAYVPRWARLRNTTAFEVILIQILFVFIPSLAGMLHAQQFARFAAGLRKTFLTAAMASVFAVASQWLVSWFGSESLKHMLLSVWVSQTTAILALWPLLYWLASAVSNRRRRIQLA